MRISDWSSDVCSSDLRYGSPTSGYGLLTQTLLYIGRLFDVSGLGPTQQLTEAELEDWVAGLPDRTQVQLTEYSYDLRGNVSQQTGYATVSARSEEHTSELQSLMRISYAVFCLKKKNK